MNFTLQKLALFLLYLLAVFVVVHKWNSPEWKANPVYQFIAILGVGLVGVLYFVISIMPRIMDRVSTAILSSNQEVERDDAANAAAMVAIGNYDGAIEAWNTYAEKNPADPYPISEIAKIHMDRLHDYPAAVQVFHDALASREWSEENAGFILTRLADLHIQAKQLTEARGILNQIIELLPDTKFSANATHRLHDLDRMVV